MKYTPHILPVLIALLIGIEAIAQSTSAARTTIDSSSVEEYIKSFHKKQEPLFAKTRDDARFGPVEKFTGWKFYAAGDPPLSVESVDKFVTVKPAGGTGALIGATVGTAAAVLVAVSMNSGKIRRDAFGSFVANSSPWVILPVGSAVGAIVGLGIGSLFRHEEDAAPITNFRLAGH